MWVDIIQGLGQRTLNITGESVKLEIAIVSELLDLLEKDKKRFQPKDVAESLTLLDLSNKGPFGGGRI